MTAQSDSSHEHIETDDTEPSAAPLLSHLLELRSRLIASLIGLCLTSIACYFIARPIFSILVAPFNAAAAKYGADQAAGLIQTGLLEVFFMELRLAFFGGLFLAFPWIAYHVYSFIGPGLYRDEKRVAVPYLIATPILFTLGAIFVYFVILPILAEIPFRSAQSASAFGSELKIAAQIKVSEYLSLVMALMFAFGLAFQLPVVLTLLGNIGLISADTLRKGRGVALVAVLAFAAIFTPPDPYSQIALTIPVMLLYELSIWCVVLIQKGKNNDG